MSSELVSALIGLSGAIVGGLIQSYWTRKSQNQLFDRNNRREVFDEFLMSFIGLLSYPKAGDDWAKCNKSYVESKMKIFLLGSPELLVAFEEQTNSAGQDTDEAWSHFRQIALKMRCDLKLPVNRKVKSFAKILFSKPISEANSIK